MSSKKQLILSFSLVAIAGVVVLVYVISGGAEDAGSSTGGHDHAAMAATDDEGQPVHLDDEGAGRIGVTYTTVQRKILDRTVRTVATVTYDETRLTNVNPKIEGWVERLYVDFTGAPVRRGQPLLDIYSPMLVSAQEELILARRLMDESAREPGTRATQKAKELLDSTRRRLAYWDIPTDEIARIEGSRTPQKTLTLRAPASGIVIEKDVLEGTRVMPGMDLYTIADLSTVWVEGEVFEKDLSLVSEGQPTSVTLEAYPGETFSGEVTYVYPTVSLEARTGRIRVELSNPDLRVKPGMYATVELEAPTTQSVLVVPRAAVHATGERSFVFVRREDGMLVSREVTTGLVSDPEIEILEGLDEGEQIVSAANFLIDAESSMGSAIGAMPGMEMETPEPPTEETAPDHQSHTAKGK